MPTIKLYPLGASGGFSGGNGGEYGERHGINGWSLQSARGNTQFLRSVRTDLLPEWGLAFTFTVRDVPTPAQWKKLKRKITIALTERFGCVCWHMVTEWTKEGRPHLHGCAFWLEFHIGILSKLKMAWLKYSKEFGTLDHGQLVKPIEGAEGWFIYMGKHASRGMSHYQRQRDNLPEEWKSNTGRVWSSGGRWPTEMQEDEVNDGTFFMFRRLTDRHAMAQAVAELRRARHWGKPSQIGAASKRIVFLKRLRKSFGEGQSASTRRGINQWVPMAVSSPLLRLCVACHDLDVENERAFQASLDHHGLTEEEIPY